MVQTLRNAASSLYRKFFIHSPHHYTRDPYGISYQNAIRRGFSLASWMHDCPILIVLLSVVKFNIFCHLCNTVHSTQTPSLL